MIKLLNCQGDEQPNQINLGTEFGNQYLTRREFEVLKYVILGYSAKKIGNLLQISSRTVEGYVDKLKEKLGCSGRGEISFIAIKSGLINLFDLI